MKKRASVHSNTRFMILLMLLTVFTILLITGCSVNLTEGKTTAKTRAVQKHYPALIEELPTLQTINTAELPSSLPCLLPKTLLGTECCLDDNQNKICDKNEAQTTCGDLICSPGENSCTCVADCGSCEAQPAGLCQQNVCENNVCTTKIELSCCGDAVCDITTESCNTCYQDCCTVFNFPKQEKLDLSKYPGIAVGLSTVVGDKAPPEDVVTAADILTHIASEGKAVGKAKLASEINVNMKDYIIVGSPCHNQAAYELFKKEIKLNNNNCQIFKPGEGVVKIIPTSASTVSIYVGGYTALETRLVSRYLSDYKNKKPTGSEVRI